MWTFLGPKLLHFTRLAVVLVLCACTSKISVSTSGTQQPAGNASEYSTEPSPTPIAEGDPSHSQAVAPSASPEPTLEPLPSAVSISSPLPSPSPSSTPPGSNVSPQLSITAPTSAVNVPMIGSYQINFVAMDSDNDASVSLFYKTSDADCDETLSGWTAIAVGLSENSVTSHMWETNSLGPDTYHICGRISDGVNADAYVLASGTVVINAPPSLSNLTPATLAIVPQIGTYTINYSPVDPDNNASVSLYYKADTSGCEQALAGWTQIVTGLSVDSVSSYGWTTDSVPAGTYYICARIVDTLNPPAFALSASTIKINAVPTFAWTVTGATGRLIPATTFSMGFAATDPDDAATISIYRRAANSGSCVSGTLLTSTLVEGTDSSFTWDASGEVNSGLAYLCAYIQDGVNPAASVYTPNQVLYRNCIWTGSVSTDWTDPGNWSDCGVAYPNNQAKALIPAGPANQPVISGSISLLGFCAGGGGGTVTIDAAGSLSNSGQLTTFLIESDVRIKGSSPTCGTCRFRYSHSSSTVATVKNGAKLTLGNGLGISGTGFLQVGDGLSHGHIETVADSGNAAEYPYFDALYNTFGFSIKGTAGNRSTIKFTGIRVLDGYSTHGFVELLSDYEVLAMDKVLVEPTYDAGPIVYAKSCSTGVFTDSTWTGWSVNNKSIPGSIGTVKSDVDCDTFASVAISGNGIFYGSFAEFAYDAGNIFNWVNGNRYTCTWTGTNGTAFDDSQNWSGCNNGRNNYPDYNDIVVITNIPVNQPTLSTTIALSDLNTGVALGSGGTLTVAAGADVSIDEVDGQITLQGDSTTCTTCVVTSPPRSLGVQNGAELVLGSGIYVGGSSVGLSTGGRFKTDIASSNPNEWPHVGNRLTFGTSNFVSINGLRVSRTGLSGTLVNFNGSGSYTINRFDNVMLDSNVTTNDFVDKYIVFANIGGAILNDTTWSGIDFVDGIATGGSNIWFTNQASMVTPGVISISPLTGGSNLGYGAAYTNDPINFINWQ